MIAITQNAEKIIRSQAKSGEGLRIKVVAGGCAAYMYELGFSKPLEGDSIIQQGAALVIVDKDSISFLKGSVVDYRSGLQNNGFVVRNPNVKRSCSCGHSVA
ncbi:iron-sulfur cluster assembly accessory protein [Candidatus Woesearchaeota archaeon]|nr:iron-sulfur cluster assembly accessory protein [Candidatus Woesearchaeota archaeon]